ncbi:hypothetical protein [Gimesia fumaroli]|uniref:Glycosyltransferase RgtA/B/C/D-like domain-containing protein n=1 Tax=Gimesia fumaroli TaxID=2527976 RepID=A0A518IG26_9PLAN|nr:hypothetical protein [Gimesia fumaroli]QDV52033.1 hypothetical protein Enr17x_40920 [Gimesia fumaroli]
MKTTLILLTCYVFAALVLLTRVVPTQFVRFKILKPLRDKLPFLRSPRLALLTVFLLSFVLSAGISQLKKPVPRIHDEFSYLLASDTFSQGRLTNPTHPFWKHFESFHIIHHPSYTSKYPPGQGLFLATGQVLTGRPIVGAWLSVALACAAICWMLQAWVPLRWAFAGGLLSALHPLMILWGQNYWGGAVAVLGGALLFGALRRLIKLPQLSTTLIFGLGLFLLAISRPFEGFLAAVSATGLLLIWMIRQTQFPKPVLLRSILLPLAASGLCIGGALLFYNWSLTGDTTRFPYQVHEETYSITPLFIWGMPREVDIINPHLEQFHTGWSFDAWQKQQELSGYLDMVLLKLTRLAGNLIVFPLGILLLMVPWVIKERWGRVALSIVLLICLVNLLLTTFFQPHYLAPVIPLFFFIFIQGARHWRVAKWKDRHRGPVFVAGLCLIFVAMSLTRVWLFTTDPRLPAQYEIASQRSKLLEQLQRDPGKDLVFVQYDSDHDPHFEWIYNRADIDNADVVWAHILDEKENQRLIKHFADRQVWWINADEDVIELKPIESMPANPIPSKINR